MKKAIAFLLMVVLIMSLGVSVAFAAPSVEAEGIISGVESLDSNKEYVDINVEKIDGNVKKPLYEVLQGLKSETKDKTLKIVGHYNVKIDGNPSYPITISLDVLGISDSSKVYVLVQKGKEIVVITPTVKDGKIIFEIDEPIDKFAIVTDGKTANKVEKENNVLSPQTADTTSLMLIFMVIIAVAFVLVPKKVEA